jgi:hypothetical protein
VHNINTNTYNAGCMCVADVRGEAGQFCGCEEYSGGNGYLLPSSGQLLNLIIMSLCMLHSSVPLHYVV